MGLGGITNQHARRAAGGPSPPAIVPGVVGDGGGGAGGRHREPRTIGEQGPAEGGEEGRMRRGRVRHMVTFLPARSRPPRSGAEVRKPVPSGPARSRSPRGTPGRPRYMGTGDRAGCQSSPLRSSPPPGRRGRDRIFLAPLGRKMRGQPAKCILTESGFPSAPIHLGSFRHRRQRFAPYPYPPETILGSPLTSGSDGIRPGSQPLPR